MARSPDDPDTQADVRNKLKRELEGKADFQQELEAFAGRRRYMNGAAAIGDRHRIAPRGLGRHNIVHHHTAAEFGQPVENPLPERAAVEQARPFGSQCFQSAGEVGLLQHEARLHRAGACGVDARPFGMQGLVARKLAGHALDFFEVELDELEAVTRDGDCGGKQLRQLLLAVRLVEFAPAREIARRTDRHGATLELAAVAELVDREVLGDLAYEVERADALLLGDVAGRHAAAGQSGHVGFHDIQSCRRGDCCVEGIAAVRQDACSGSGSQRMGRSDHAVPRCDCRTFAVLQHSSMSPP